MLKSGVIFRYIVIRVLSLLLWVLLFFMLFFLLAAGYHFFVDASFESLIKLSNMFSWAKWLIPSLLLIVFISKDLNLSFNKAHYVEHILSYSNLKIKDLIKNILFLMKLKNSELAKSAAKQKNETLVNAQNHGNFSFRFFKVIAFQLFISIILLFLFSLYVGKSDIVNFSNSIFSYSKIEKFNLELANVRLDDANKVYVKLSGLVPYYFGTNVVLSYGDEIRALKCNQLLNKEILIGTRSSSNKLRLDFENDYQVVLDLFIEDFSVEDLYYYINYPSYLNRAKDTLRNINGESFPKGSTIDVHLKGKNVKLHSIMFNNAFTDGEDIVLNIPGLNELLLEIENIYYKSRSESLFYVTEDLGPNLYHNVVKQGDSLLITINASDDFGLKDLEIRINNQLVESNNLEGRKELSKEFKLPFNERMKDLEIKLKDTKGNDLKERIDLNKELSREFEERKTKDREGSADEKKEKESNIDLAKQDLKNQIENRKELLDILEMFQLSKDANKQDKLVKDLEELKQKSKKDADLLKDLSNLLEKIQNDKKEDTNKEQSKKELAEEIEKLKSKMSKYRKRKQDNSMNGGSPMNIAAEQANIELILLMANALSHKAEKSEDLFIQDKLLYLTFKDSVTNFALRNIEIGEEILSTLRDIDIKFDKLPGKTQGIFYELNNISLLFYEILKNKTDKENKDKKEEKDEGDDGSCNNLGEGGKPKKSDLLSEGEEGQEQPDSEGVDQGEEGQEGESDGEGEKEGDFANSSNRSGTNQSELENLLKQILSEQGQQGLTEKELEEKRRLLKAIRREESEELRRELVVKLMETRKGVKQEDLSEQRKANTFEGNKDVLKNNEYLGIRNRNSLDNRLNRNPLILR